MPPGGDSARLAAYDRGMSSAPASGTDARQPQTPSATTTEDAEPRPASSSGGLPAIVRRRLGPLEDRLDPYSWLAAGVVTFIAAVIRLYNLSFPSGKVFDEVYYAKDAHDLLVLGYEWDQPNNMPEFVVHPPLGKWLIALGERPQFGPFGYNEFGWRISAAVVGILSVLMITRIARRMFGSTVLGCAAGLLMAFDGMHFVMSRFALLDIFLMFFVVAAFGALVIDRDARRGRWLRALEAGLDPSRPGRAGRLKFTWPGGVPWWRLFAAVLLGCAMGVKWSALWFIPAFALLALFWDAGARRSAGVRRPWRDTFLDEIGWLALCGVLIVGTYVITWSGWMFTDGGYFRHWVRDSGGNELPVIGTLQNLWHYHTEALKFHNGLTSDHDYQSWPWQWLLLGRPVLFYFTCEGDCTGSAPTNDVLLLGTPVLWWSFIPALVGLAWLGIARRDWRAAAIGTGVAAGILPWFYFALHGRTMFYFYALPAEPFLVLAVVYVLGCLMSPARALGQDQTLGQDPSLEPRRILGFDRRTVGVVLLAVYVLAVAACFAYFYPVYSGMQIPHDDWSARMWLGDRWI